MQFNYAATESFGTTLVESLVPNAPFHSPFLMIPYGTETYHLITRHPHSIGFKGYTASLSNASWIYFIAVTIIILVTMQTMSKVGLGKSYYWLDIPSYCGLFYRVRSELFKYVAIFKGGKYIQFLLVLTYLVFSLFYNQDLRSNTIEPYYEKLPDRLKDLDMESQHVLVKENVPFHKKSMYYTIFIKHFYGYKKELYAMAVRNTFFIHTSKQVY